MLCILCNWLTYYYSFYIRIAIKLILHFCQTFCLSKVAPGVSIHVHIYMYLYVHVR